MPFPSNTTLLKSKSNNDILDHLQYFEDHKWKGNGSTEPRVQVPGDFCSYPKKRELFFMAEIDKNLSGSEKLPVVLNFMNKYEGIPFGLSINYKDGYVHRYSLRYVMV